MTDYKWWLNNGISLISISASLLDAFSMICIFPSYPYLYSIPDLQVLDFQTDGWEEKALLVYLLCIMSGEGCLYETQRQKLSQASWHPWLLHSLSLLLPRLRLGLHPLLILLLLLLLILLLLLLPPCHGNLEGAIQLGLRVVLGLHSD